MIQKQFEELMDLYDSIKQQVRRKNKHLYERWKAGGFIIDNDIVSMYPCLEQVVELVLSDEDEDED